MKATKDMNPEEKKSYSERISEESITLQNELAPILGKYHDPNVILTTLTRLLIGAINMARYVYPTVNPEDALERIFKTIRVGLAQSLGDPHTKELFEAIKRGTKKSN